MHPLRHRSQVTAKHDHHGLSKAPIGTLDTLKALVDFGELFRLSLELLKALIASVVQKESGHDFALADSTAWVMTSRQMSM